MLRFSSDGTEIGLAFRAILRKVQTAYLPCPATLFPQLHICLPRTSRRRTIDEREVANVQVRSPRPIKPSKTARASHNETQELDRVQLTCSHGLMSPRTCCQGASSRGECRHVESPMSSSMAATGQTSLTGSALSGSSATERQHPRLLLTYEPMSARQHCRTS